MSSCVARRWAGTGTTKEKPTNEALSKEMNDRLLATQAERAKQDAFLFGGQQQSSQELTLINSQPKGAVEIPVFDKAKTRGF